MSEPTPAADDPSWVDNVLARARARAQAQAQAATEPRPPLANPDPFVVREALPPARTAAPAARPETLPAVRGETAPAVRAEQSSRAPSQQERLPAVRGETAPAAVRAEQSSRATSQQERLPEPVRRAEVAPARAPKLGDAPAVAPRAERRIMPTPMRTEFEPVDRSTVYSELDAEPDEDATDEEDESSGLRNAVEWIAVAVGAVLVAFLIRAFLIQAFYIPSESMLPTLRKDDRILVNKLSYRMHDVNRGDLVVFERPPSMPPDDHVKDLIKRVIALPGETIELRGNDIFIDDRKLTEPYLPDGTVTVNLRWVNGCANPPSEIGKCTIPPGHVFVMGDNRGASTDGRVFGPISEDLIVGRAFVRVWPLGGFKSL